MPLWETIKNNISQNIKSSTTFLKWNIKKSSDISNGTFCPLGWLFYSQLKIYQNKDNKTKIIFCWKSLDRSQNNCEGLTQWDFVSLGDTITYTTSNLNNLRNFIGSNQCIYCDSWYHKNWNPRHNLPQNCRGRKSVCPFWVQTTDNFQ